MGIELPVRGDVPSLGNLLVDDGIVVLEVGAETLSLQSCPNSKLSHAIRLRCPAVELVLVDGEVLLVVFNGGAVIEKQDLFPC